MWMLSNCFFMSVTVTIKIVNNSFHLQSEHENDDTIIDEDTADKTADITEEQNETTVLESTDKTIELHESENSTNEDEKVTCVDEPNTKNVVDVADDDNDVNGVDGAPLASMESDPAPLASLESSTTAEMPSM